MQDAPMNPSIRSLQPIVARVIRRKRTPPSCRRLAHLSARGIFDLIRRSVQIEQKTVEESPEDKVIEMFLTWLAGAQKQDSNGLPASLLVARCLAPASLARLPWRRDNAQLSQRSDPVGETPMLH